MHVNETNFFYWLFTLKINPAVIMHKDTEENKNAIKNHQNYI